MFQSTNINLLERPIIKYSLKPRSIKQKSKIYLATKRWFDIFLSLFVILFILPWLLPILTILIKLDSKGPVFFAQRRIGLFGKPFNCLKFRSMVVNDDADIEQADINDPRITRLGTFLRVSCIDELPQFINILIGDMSVVGPRPHMIKDCDDFSKIVLHYSLRNSMRPGITGIAQMKGYCGKTKNFFDVCHRYQWDIFYLRNACFLLDLKIIKQTVINIMNSSMRRIRKSQ